MKLSKPVLILLLAMTLFGIRAPLVKWLAVQGENIGLYGRDAISFCNILFVGNLCAALVVVSYFGPMTIYQELKVTKPKGYVLLLISALLELIAPALFFIAIKFTSITNVILLSRFGPLLFSVVGALVFRNPISIWQWVGYGFSATAICIVVIYGGMWSLNKGDILMLLGGVINCLATVVNRYTLQASGLRSFLFVRNLVGSIAFFGIALYFFGWPHFGEAFEPEIWLVMVFYAVIAVVGAELTWYYALERVQPSTIGSFSFVSPTMGIVFAYLLLFERPVPAQWVALGLVITGIVIANVKTICDTWTTRASQPSLVAN